MEQMIYRANVVVYKAIEKIMNRSKVLFLIISCIEIEIYLLVFLTI